MSVVIPTISNSSVVDHLEEDRSDTMIEEEDVRGEITEVLSEKILQESDLRGETLYKDFEQDSQIILTPLTLPNEQFPISQRKPRWRPTPDQRQILDSIWFHNPYPNKVVKSQLIKQFGDSVTYKQITSWFKHKRENNNQKGNFEYRYSPALKFTNEQILFLEVEFQKQNYTKGKALCDLANQLGVHTKRIQTWFKHRRSRLTQGRFEYKESTPLNSEQITFLKNAFCTNPTPTSNMCEQLSSQLNVKPEQVTFF